MEEVTSRKHWVWFILAVVLAALILGLIAMLSESVGISFAMGMIYMIVTNVLKYFLLIEPGLDVTETKTVLVIHKPE